MGKGICKRDQGNVRGVKGDLSVWICASFVKGIFVKEIRYSVCERFVTFLRRVGGHGRAVPPVIKGLAQGLVLALVLVLVLSLFHLVG